MWDIRKVCRNGIACFPPSSLMRGILTMKFQVYGWAEIAMISSAKAAIMPEIFPLLDTARLLSVHEILDANDGGNHVPPILRFR